MPRILLTTLLVLTALVLQVTVVNRLPVSDVPDFVLLVVIALAAIRGPVAGGRPSGSSPACAPICCRPSTTHWASTRWSCAWSASRPVGGPNAGRCSPSPYARRGRFGFLALAVGGLLGDPGIDLRTFEVVWPMAALVNLLAAPVVVWAVLKVCRPRPQKATAAAVPGWRRA